MSALIRFVLLFVQLTFISATFEIPFRCFIWDAGCLTTLAQIATPIFAKGFPDIGTKPLDPMYIPSLRIDQEGFKGDLTNLTIIGYKDSIIKKMFVDSTNSLVSLAFQSDLQFNGRYKSITEDPEADILMLIRNVDIHLIMPFEIIKNANNTDIMLLKRYEYTYDIKEAQSYLRDLYFPTFNNAVFFDAIQNWRLISIPIGRNFMDKFTENTFISLRTYLLSEPLRNLLEY